MNKATRKALDNFMNGLVKRNPGEPEFHQAVQEVAETVMPYMATQRLCRYVHPRAHD